jgi:integrase
MNTQLAPKEKSTPLPPILAGNTTPVIRRRVEHFFFSVASLFEAWVARRHSPHTQRAYREDVMAFARFMGMDWPQDATALLRSRLTWRNRVVFIPDSKTPTGVGEVPLTKMAAEAFRRQIELAGPGTLLFPSEDNRTGHQTEFKRAWRTALKKAGVP